METLDVRRSAGVVTVTLNRPHRLNALTNTMVAELTEVLTQVAADDGDRVLVLTGAGDGFCSGADLRELAPENGASYLTMMRRIGSLAALLCSLPKPTVARVNGVAAGAGCNMALGCDLVVAADTARFSEIFARRGLSVDFGGSWLLPRRVGMHRAKELVLLADIILAADAERMGLINRVVPAADLDAAVDDWATRLAAGPPIALAQSKALLDAGLTRSLAEALEAEAVAQAYNRTTEDTAEAVRAYLAKREPTFTGR